MNAIRRKRGGWQVVDKATRHQLHQGLFRTKKEAEQCRDNLVSKIAELSHQSYFQNCLQTVCRIQI